MRLGFYYHIPALMQDGSIRMPGYLGRFVDALAHHCDSVTCFLHSPRREEVELLDCELTASNVHLIDIGPHASAPRRMLFSPCYTAALRKHSHELDALLLRGPSPLLPDMARASGSIPMALLLVGDYLAGVDDLPQPRWRKELIRLWSTWNKHGQNAAARRALTFVNSRKLYNEYLPIAAKLVETRTTTLTAVDFFERQDTCQVRPIHLLYTGRMDRAKGVLLLVETVGILVNQGEDIILDLVGWPQKGDTIVEEITTLAENNGISKRVIYHGYRPVGPQLFEFYKNADIYVLASMSAFEGFPRTIWEAMAHSLPVMATRVGSIPGFISGAAELVEPGSAKALAQGILQLIHDESCRQDNIQKGLALARQMTLEALVPKMVEEIQTWIQRSKN